MNQKLTPLADALREQLNRAYIPFDVPGHKGNLKALSEYFGEDCLLLDKNSRAGIDYLCQPRSVIYEAEALAAEAFGAAHAFFMVGGTTSSVQAMVMSACAPGEKIILPRNVHYSVINAVILAGAVPVYISSQVHPQVGISLGMRVEDVRACIADHPDAKAILINNPTYYGICSNIEAIISIAHENGLWALVDEAHGTHFYFGDDLPKAAMHCGADLSAVSMHKTGGSLTQSSILLSNGRIEKSHITNIINLIRTTSASYLLLASLDIARQYLVTKGREVLNANLREICIAREAINEIDGYYAFAKECVDGDSIFDFDLSKLSINTLGIGLAGIEVYSLLRDEYGIQLEFGDTANILALSTLGDRPENNRKLITALTDIKNKYGNKSPRRFSYEYITPITVISPREAFYAPKKAELITKCEGKICGDAIMCYPPGIPIIAPGELITPQIIDHIMYASQKGCTVTGINERQEITVLKE
ncbi:MAG: aminotransferase class I/II-fold pyridoxal phosphate-dependent enzyme [Ruminococcaceae bacterium]|nr:aminotransferase class I/II-fold pyridoxal phosphate-dependent enzyme [Oscillospiraceae bacterium]